MLRVIEAEASEVLRFTRLVFGSALVASFVLGLVAIRRRDIAVTAA